MIARSSRLFRCHTRDLSHKYHYCQRIFAANRFLDAASGHIRHYQPEIDLDRNGIGAIRRVTMVFYDFLIDLFFFVAGHEFLGQANPRAMPFIPFRPRMFGIPELIGCNSNSLHSHSNTCIRSPKLCCNTINTPARNRFDFGTHAQ